MITSLQNPDKRYVKLDAMMGLTHILPMLHFCTPWKRQKTEGGTGGTDM